MNERDRLSKAIEQLDAKTRRIVTSMLEAIVDANELIPTGHGQSDSIGQKGFESRVPGDVHLFAAQIVREAKQAMRQSARDAARLRVMVQKTGTKPPKFDVTTAKRPGRPSVITPELVERVLTLRSVGYGPTTIVTRISAEFGISESTIWKAKERGAAAAPGTVEWQLAKALLPRSTPHKRRS